MDRVQTGGERGLGLFFFLRRSRMFRVPGLVKVHQGIQTESFHVVVINHVDAEVQQILAVAFSGSYQGTDVELQLVKHTFVDNPVAVDEVFK